MIYKPMFNAFNTSDYGQSQRERKIYFTHFYLPLFIYYPENRLAYLQVGMDSQNRDSSFITLCLVIWIHLWNNLF